jgi:hypothetical protein
MLISSYLKTPILHSKMLTEDNDLGAPEHAAPNTIKCRMDGSRRLMLGENKATAVDAFVYLTVEKIVPRDLLGGQVVLAVKPIYDLDGSVSHYESSVGGA